MPPKKKRGGKAGLVGGDSRTGGELESLIEHQVVGDGKKTKKGKEAADEWQVSTPAREDWSGGVLGLSARTSRSSSVLSKAKAIDLASIHTPSPTRSPARSISNVPGEAGGDAGRWMGQPQTGGFPGGWGGPGSNETGAWPSIMGGRSPMAGSIAMPLPQQPPQPSPPRLPIAHPSRSSPAPIPTGQSSNRSSPTSVSSHGGGKTPQNLSSHATPQQKIAYLPMSYSGGQKSSIRNMPLGVTPASLLAAQEGGNGAPSLNPPSAPPSIPGPSNHQRSSGIRSSMSSSVRAPSPNPQSIQMPHPHPFTHSQHSHSIHEEQEEVVVVRQSTASSSLPHGSPSVLRKTSTLPPPRIPIPSVLDPDKPHSNTYRMALASAGTGVESGPLLTHNMRILESGGLALKGAERAMFGSHRHASQRFFWTLPPEHSDNVNGLLDWIVAMSWGLGDLGLRKFLSWRDRGALFVNADFRPWSNPEEPAFDWMTFADAQKTRDQTLQESMASYDPATTVLVFAFLVSDSGSSLGIWRRKVSVPVSLQLHYANQINRIKKELEMSRPPVIRIEEDTQPPAPISLYAPGRSVVDPIPLPPPKPRKKRRWWQFWKKKRKTKMYSR